MAAQSGDWDAARKAFDAAEDYGDAKAKAAEAQRNSATVSAAYAKGTEAIKAENFIDAYNQLRLVIGLSPHYKDAQTMLATATTKLDTIVEAASKARQEGKLEDAAAGFDRCKGYKNCTDQAKGAADAATRLSTEYGTMKQQAATKDYLGAAATAGKILTVAEYRDTRALSVDCTEQAYGPLRDWPHQAVLRRACKHSPILASSFRTTKT